MNDGGPVHPDGMTPGITLRDLYAGMVLQGIVIGWKGLGSQINADEVIQQSAQLAYLTADAMLKEREKQNETPS